MMAWLSKQPSWGTYAPSWTDSVRFTNSYGIAAQARDVEISSNKGVNSAAVVLDGNDDESALFKSSRKLAYLPSLSRTYSLWYKRRWITITRTQQQTGWYGNKERTLSIVSCGFHSVE